MTNEIDRILDDLLARWHHYSKHYRHTRGFNGKDNTCRDYAAPTHWDWHNGAEDDRAEQQIMRGVDAAVARVPNTPCAWNLALQFEARNLASQYAVWNSPRLPQGEELKILVLEARNKLLVELQREGAIG